MIEVIRQIGGGLIARFGIALQTMRNDRLQIAVKRGRERTQARRISRGSLTDDRECVCADERGTAGE